MLLNNRKKKKNKYSRNIGYLGKAKVRRLLLVSMTDAITGIIMMATDKIILGNMMGSDAVSATMLIAPIMFCSEAFTSLISAGASLLYTRAVGNYDTDKCRRIFGMSSVMALIIGILFAGFSMVLGDDLFVFMGADGQILEYGIQYIYFFRIIFLIAPLNSFLNEIMYIDGDEIRGVISSVALLFGNAVLTILLIPRMGVRGASLGSAIGVLLAFLVTLSHFLNKKYRVAPIISFDLSIFKEMLTIGGIDALNSAVDGLYVFLVEIFVIRVLGSEYLAVTAVTGMVYEMMEIGGGISDAMKTMLISYWGDKNKEAMKSLLWFVIRLTLKICLLYVILVWLLSPILPGIYGISVPELRSFTVTVCRIVSFSSFACIFYGLFLEYYSSIGEYRLTAIGNLLDSFVIRILLVVIFGLLFGPVGMWVGEALCTYVCLFVLSAVVIKLYGKKKYPLLVDEDNGCSMNLNYVTKVDEIMEIRDRVGEFLNEKKVPKRAVNFCMLLIEDMSMLIKEENPETGKVHIDAFVSCDRECARLVLWNDGKLIDMSDQDMVPDGVRAYIVSSLLTDFEKKKYQNTAGYNRMSFMIPYKRLIKEQLKRKAE
ncbi:MAG: hypothetical protein IKR56_03600 [Lachnospiraceae bacterium]|nr:hypothetical protein [Lachnospiraceae bacterium]